MVRALDCDSRGHGFGSRYSPNFIYIMTHIIGNFIPENKSLPEALCVIYGIGHKRAVGFCEEFGINPRIKITDLTQHDIKALTLAIDSHELLDSELQRDTYLRIQSLIGVQAYRGIRHSKSLPVRGQRTSTNAKTQRRLASKRLRR